MLVSRGGAIDDDLGVLDARPMKASTQQQDIVKLLNGSQRCWLATWLRSGHRVSWINLSGQGCGVAVVGTIESCVVSWTPIFVPRSSCVALVYWMSPLPSRLAHAVAW